MLVGEGSVRLYSKTIPEVIPAKGQNVILGTTDTQDDVVFNKVYYLVHDERVIELPSKKKDFKQLILNEFGPETEAILKGLSPKKEANLKYLTLKLSTL